MSYYTEEQREANREAWCQALESGEYQKGRGLLRRGHVMTAAAALAPKRQAEKDGINFFPTPPWVTRALFEHVLKPQGLWTQPERIYEPACGTGDMAYALWDYGPVRELDIHPYLLRTLPSQSDGSLPDGQPRFLGPDRAVQVQDFLSYWPADISRDWIITNPPYEAMADGWNISERFVLHALRLRPAGVAMFLPATWVYGQKRWERIMKPCPPPLRRASSSGQSYNRGA